jgi:transcriptional regulator, tetR family
MQVKILLSRSFIDKTISDQLGNVIIHSIIKPISSVLNQFKEKGVIRDWSNERIVRYILALSLSYIIPMMLNDNEDVNIDETVNEIVECLSFALVEVK